jgi:hypothetical protein
MALVKVRLISSEMYSCKSSSQEHFFFNQWPLFSDVRNEDREKWQQIYPFDSTANE